MAMNKPDAVISDLDRSLLGPDQRVGERDLAAIRRMKELGVPVLPGTGRPPLRVRALARELGLEMAICSNGGCCYDFAKEEVLSAQFLEPRVARRLTDWLLERKILFVIHTPQRTYRSPGAEVVPRYDSRTKEDEKRYMFTPDTPLEQLPVLKILAVECDETAVLAQVRRDFPEGEISACISEPTFVDCNPAGVNKGSGLRRLAAVKGWRMENILALGDNHNDRAMLEAAGKSAVPADGVEEIRKIAGFVTAPCGQNPLAAAIEHYYPGLLEGI